MYAAIEGATPLIVPEAVAAMFNWSQKKGIKWPKIIYPVRFPPGYIGSMAVEDIYPNERIMTAPNSSLITSKVAEQSELSSFFAEHSEFFSRTLTLIAFLLHEKFKGKSSE